MMRVAKPLDDRQRDLLRPGLGPGAAVGGDRLAVSRPALYSSACTAGDGRPPLPTRLVAGLFILKHMHNLSDAGLCARWL